MWKPREKQARLKQGPVKDKDYLKYMHSQNFGCHVCGLPGIELHHVYGGLVGRDDTIVVPLCPEHHRGKFSPHGFDSVEFYKQYPKEELEAVARMFYAEYILDGRWME